MQTQRSKEFFEQYLRRDLYGNVINRLTRKLEVYDNNDSDKSNAPNVHSIANLISDARYRGTLQINDPTICTSISDRLMKSLIKVEFEGIVDNDFLFQIESNGNPIVTINKPYLTFEKCLNTLIRSLSWNEICFLVKGFTGKIIFTMADYIGPETSMYYFHTGGKRIDSLISKIYLESTEPIKNVLISSYTNIDYDEDQLDEMYAEFYPGKKRPDNLAVIAIANEGAWFKDRNFPSVQINNGLVYNDRKGDKHKIFYWRDNVMLSTIDSYVPRFTA